MLEKIERGDLFQAKRSTIPIIFLVRDIKNPVSLTLLILKGRTFLLKEYN